MKQQLSGPTALLIALAAACGGSVDAPPADPDAGGDGHPDGGPCAADACFLWSTTPVPTPPDATASEDYYWSCNPLGVRPGMCADGFACGTSETLGDPYVVHTPVCSPGGEPPRRTIDLEIAPPPPADAVQLALDFTLAGAPWPDASELLGRAGVITLTRPGDAFRFDVSARHAENLVAVPPGFYEVDLVLNDPTSQYYPRGAYHGSLVVNRAGRVAVDVPAATARYALRVDGAAFGALPSGSKATLKLVGAYSTVVRDVRAPDVVDGSLVLRPDTYRVVLEMNGQAGQPLGVTTVATALGIAERADVTLPLDVQTVDVSGGVSIDSADLPAGGSGGQVEFRRDGKIFAAAIGAARPASFRARLLAGRYDVLYDARATQLPGVPRGIALASRDREASGLQITLDTVEVSGDVIRSGALAPAGVAARVQFRNAYGTTTIATSTAEGAPYRGRVFAGVYDVAVEGDGVRLPAVSTPVAASWRAVPAEQHWSMSTRRLAVTMTHNGAVPAAVAEVGDRGDLIATATLADRKVTVRTTSSLSGPIAASWLLPDATWTVSYENNDSRYRETPGGRAELGTVVLAGGPDETRAYDLASVWISGQVLIAGAALPAAAEGARGVVHVNSFRHGGQAQANMAIPLAGDATYSGWLTPGVYDIGYYCTPPTCVLPGVPDQRDVHTSIRIR